MDTMFTRTHPYVTGRLENEVFVPYDFTRYTSVDNASKTFNKGVCIKVRNTLTGEIWSV